MDLEQFYRFAHHFNKMRKLRGEEMEPIDKQYNNCYKITVNHVSLSSLGTIFDWWMHNINYDQLVCGYELGAKQKNPHFQVYIQNTDIDTHEHMRYMLCEDLYKVGVIDEKMTCVAFPLDDPSDATSHHLVNYSQKDGHYIKHLPNEGVVECCWANVRGQWHDDHWRASLFDHFRENCLSYPRFIDHIRSWGPESSQNFFIDSLDTKQHPAYNKN